MMHFIVKSRKHERNTVNHLKAAKATELQKK